MTIAAHWAQSSDFKTQRKVMDQNKKSRTGWSMNHALENLFDETHEKFWKYKKYHKMPVIAHKLQFFDEVKYNFKVCLLRYHWNEFNCLLIIFIARVRPEFSLQVSFNMEHHLSVKAAGLI